MRKLTIFLLLISGSLLAQNRSIFFEHGSWESALAKAKKENKLIYLDCYTSWCGPCKWMARNVFTNDTAADFYNGHFINYKMDMEKGEGPALVKQYGIIAFPTMLYINGDGIQVHRSCGATDVATFIGNGEKAMDPAKQLLHFDLQMKAGTMTIADMQQYLELLSSACQQNDTLVNIYLNQLPPEKLLEADAWELFKKFVKRVDTRSFLYVEQHKNEFIAKYSADTVGPKLSKVYSMELNRASRLNDSVRFEQLRQRLKKLDVKDGDRVLSASLITRYMDLGRWEAFGKQTNAYIDQYGQKEDAIIQFCMNQFTEHVSSNEELMHLLPYAGQCAEHQPDNYYLQLDYARFLVKCKQWEAAKKQTESCLGLAKKNGYSQDPPKKLLKEINKALETK